MVKYLKAIVWFWSLCKDAKRGEEKCVVKEEEPSMMAANIPVKVIGKVNYLGQFPVEEGSEIYESVFELNEGSINLDRVENDGNFFMLYFTTPLKLMYITCNWYLEGSYMPSQINEHKLWWNADVEDGYVVSIRVSAVKIVDGNPEFAFDTMPPGVGFQVLGY